MLRFLPILAGFAVVTVSAIDYGRQTGRWHQEDNLSAIKARLEQLPSELGDWRSQSATLDARQMEVARIDGYLLRNYVNRKTGDELQMLLVCGQPGPIAAHTPDVCYAGAGYIQKGKLEKKKVDGNEFVVGNFAKGPPLPDPLCIWWAWSADGHWMAPDYPRLAFGRNTSALCKLYVVRRITPGHEAAVEDSTEDFLRVMLPELKHCLSPSP